MSPKKRKRRLAKLSRLYRVWGGVANGPGDVTPGLIQLCRDWITPNALMVEVGCCRGVSTRVFACFAYFVWAVDPWTHASQGAGYTDVPPKMLLAAEAEFHRETAAYKNIRAVRDFSLHAAEHFPPASLDAVYLDGEHETGPFCRDVEAWLPKLKPTGLLMGHDFDKVGGNWERLGLPDAAVYPETSWVVRVEDIKR